MKRADGEVSIGDATLRLDDIALCVATSLVARIRRPSAKRSQTVSDESLPLRGEMSRIVLENTASDCSDYRASQSTVQDLAFGTRTCTTVADESAVARPSLVGQTYDIAPRHHQEIVAKDPITHGSCAASWTSAMSAPGGPVFLTAQQVAEMLQVDERTVLRWAQRDASMPATRLGRVVRFEREPLLRWLAHKQTKCARAASRAATEGATTAA